MDSSQNQSKLQVLFGEEIGSNEQSSLRLELHVGKQKAIDQANKVKQLVLNQVETSTSLALVLPCLESNQEKLIELLESLFNGSSQVAEAKSIHKQVSAGNILYDIVRNQNKVIVVVRPTGELEQMVTSPIEMALSSPGMKELVDTQNNSIILDLKSINTFREIDEFIDNGDTFIVALLRSLKVSLALDIHQNLFKAVMELLEAIDPALTQSPLGMLQMFKSFNIDLKLAGSHELPDSIVAGLLKAGKFKLLVSPDSMPEPEKNFWKTIKNVVDPGIEVFVTVENALAVHIDTNVPGFATHVTKNLK